MPANIEIISRQPVYAAMASREYSGTSGDYLNVAHKEALSLPQATISLSFSMDRQAGEMALVSKDGNGRDAGDFTVWLKDGQLIVSQESGDVTKSLKVPGLVFEANETYQFALSVGKDGLMIWLNGDLVAAEPEFAQGMAGNTHPLVVGGTRAWRESDGDAAHSLFKGMIGDVLVYDKQLGEGDMLKLAAAVDPHLAMPSSHAAEMADLAPVLEQLHHASDTLKDILSEYGFGHGHDHSGMGGMGMGGHDMDGPGMDMSLNMISRGNADNEVEGTKDRDGINGGGGDDTVTGKGGNDVLQGGYGNDKLVGGGGRDILDGGHGEDKLIGGGGNDLLISRADGREGAIWYDPNRDEGDPLGELTDGKLYPEQPIPADDVLTGGKGADIFYFQTLINAKQRYIEKHTNDDGSINWHGVAGENDKLHDHWVDVIGNDVVTDYSRAEGDRLVIEGHTTEILSIEYGDANGDGVLDHSVIRLYSDQGNNGGAHNDDRLGSITVYGDLVKESDIEHTAAPAYGIVQGIRDLDEALTPTDMGENGGRIRAPSNGKPADLGLPGHLTPVAAITGTTEFSGETGDYMDVGHLKALELGSATISLSRTLDRLPGEVALVSKDANGRGPGEFTVWVGDRVVARKEGGEFPTDEDAAAAAREALAGR